MTYYVFGILFWNQWDQVKFSNSLELAKKLVKWQAYPRLAASNNCDDTRLDSAIESKRGKLGYSVSLHIYWLGLIFLVLLLVIFVVVLIFLDLYIYFLDFGLINFLMVFKMRKMFELQIFLQIIDNVSDELKCELIRICYLNILYKCYRKICDYNNTFKRINDIFKRTKV